MYKYDVFFVCINLFELSGCLCSCHRKSAAKNEVIRSDDFKMERVFRILKPDTGSRPKNLIKKPSQTPHHRIHFFHRSKTTLFDLWSSHFCIVLNITAGGHPFHRRLVPPSGPHPAWRGPAGFEMFPLGGWGRYMAVQEDCSWSASTCRSNSAKESAFVPSMRS